MTASTDCPDAVRLKGLLDSEGAVPIEDQELVDHLDSCVDCQHQLESLATGEWAWKELRGAGEPAAPPSHSAYWPALKDLEREMGTDRSPEEVATAALPATAPRAADDTGLDFLSPPDSPGFLGKLGHFNVVGVVGRGGMGVVLKSLDVCLQRFVAIKVLDPKFANDDTAHHRFCREARAAAAVTHENVVAIHQVEHEEDKDLPFLVMQFVSGVSLQDRLDDGGPLPLHEILRIGMQTAAGLAAAHAQGLVHRDIKPGNILIESGTDRVKITDFGLARAAEDVKLTQTGFAAGTPLYMAPEQARGEPLDHRTDLFSFGSVLYAMCTGRPPFEGSTPFVVLRKVTDEKPRPIQEINPAIPDWLESIIERLQAKDPADRYQSAAEVESLLSEHHARLRFSSQWEVPFSSAPARPGSTLSKWGDPRYWTVAAIVAWLLLGAVVVSERVGFTNIRDRDARAELEDGPIRSPRAVLKGNAGPIWSIAFTRDQRTLAMGIDDGSVKLWDPKNASILATIDAHAGPVWSLAYSPDGSLLATASDDGTVKLWDTRLDNEVRSLAHPTSVRSLAFAPDGKRLATGSRTGAVKVWDTQSGKELVTTKGHVGVVVSVAFSPDGKTVASAGGDKKVKLWNSSTGLEQVALLGHFGGVYSVAFSPDGKTIASGGWDKIVRIWEASTGNPISMFEGHTQDIWSVAFSPDGKALASASEDRSVRVWELESGEETAVYRGQASAFYAVAFAADGHTIAAGGRDGSVRIWEASTP